MFNAAFLWGCSTAGYQVELPPGNADWDAFLSAPEITNRVHTFQSNAGQGDVEYTKPVAGVGHENLDVLRVELDRLRELGLNAYRFSVEWNQIQPIRPSTDRPGNLALFAAQALDHYIAIVREIVDRGMTPIITLNHMSLPSWALTPPLASRLIDPFGVANLPVAAEDDQWRGSLRGWETDDTVAAFVAFVALFASKVHENFPGTRMLWLTLNEPIGSMVGAGYLGALWCPGFGGEADRGKRVCLHLVKAHVLAFKALKAIDPDWQVGFAHAMLAATPTSFSSALAGLESGAAIGAGIGVGIGSGLGAADGAIAGAALGAALLGPLGLLIGLIAGAIGGAVAGAAEGAMVGGVIGGVEGAISGGAGNIQQAATDQFDYFTNEWMLRAVVKGEIDEDLADGSIRSPAEWDAAWARVIGADAGVRGGNLDFVGVNYYRRVHVYYYPVAKVYAPYTGGVFHNNMEGAADPHGVLNELGWEVFPEGLGTFLRRIKRDFDKPILVTENGTPEALDANRAASLVAHVDEIRKATEDADPPVVLGYIHWSVVDNWEWHEGYHPKSRFGLHTLGDRNDNITIGGTRTFRRQLTEAGLAFRDLILSSDITPARLRFGAVAAGGERTDLPTITNGALWEGDLDGEHVKLFLDTAEDRELIALIYHARANFWLSPDVRWDGAARRLSLSHGAQAAPMISTLSADLALDPTTFLFAGFASAPENETLRPFRIKRVISHGLWLPTQPAGSWKAIAMHRLFDGDTVVKRLLTGDGNRWEAFRAREAQTIRFAAGADAFEVAFGADPRNLTVSKTAGPPSAAPTVATFRRARSSLEILGET
jgi:beta-glucosidase/6-phospho-beta-glucosidase/beta-galactosidase